jgi:16S rRNA (cytidine1402-2'-O)-methyltransferase
VVGRDWQPRTSRCACPAREADLIACEDTRHTARLLNHYGITTPCESHHEHNEAAHTPRLLDMLQEGKNIALVSDAGTPLLSDPGYTLVSGCRERGLAVVDTALGNRRPAGSGLPTDSFFCRLRLQDKDGRSTRDINQALRL